MTLKDLIRSRARDLGFSSCGFARAEPLESLRPFYRAFLRQGKEAGLSYLKRTAEQRLDPGLLLPGVQTVIALLMNYYPNETIPAEDNFIIARYAYGKDYQTLIRKRLRHLAEVLSSTGSGISSRWFVDSGPLLEKVWAQRCGLGWQGKNTLLIHETAGSFFFIGIILTTVALPPDPPGKDRCGSCQRCMEACPTAALTLPYQLDIDRCISYHTIVNKREVPEALCGKFRDRIFGCDICQDVCPYNRRPAPHREAHFRPLPGLAQLRKAGWLAMSEATFNRIFRHSEIGRTGYKTFRRNMELAGAAYGTTSP